jgi:hypothetical protein
MVKREPKEREVQSQEEIRKSNGSSIQRQRQVPVDALRTSSISAGRRRHSMPACLAHCQEAFGIPRAADPLSDVGSASGKIPDREDKGGCTSSKGGMLSIEVMSVGKGSAVVG